MREALSVFILAICFPLSALGQPYQYPQQGYFYPVAPPPYVQPAPGQWRVVYRPTWVGNFLFGPVHYWEPAQQQPLTPYQYQQPIQPQQ